VTLARAGDTRVWPYPLLCLAWRLGWGGRRVVDRDRSEGPGLVLHPLERGSGWPLRGHPSSDGVAADALIALDVDLTGASETPEDASRTIDRVTRLLRRSPLAALIAGAEPASFVVTGAVALIRPDLPAGHDVRLPPFWRPALTAWPGWREPRWVPRPRPRWDPATWTLVGVLETAWEATGTTFLGRERPVLFQVAGTRRMAARHGWSPRRTLACGRTAHRIWRHWFEQREQARVDRLRTWPVDRRVAATLGDPILAYRVMRAAVRTGHETPDLGGVPASLRRLLWSLARASIADLAPPVVPQRPAGLRVGVARALLATPIGVAAARSGADPRALWAAANETAARILWPLTAPWPWTARPVVRGPRRARQEARRRAAALRP
jgi:hypothetical protein